ncbi:uncharacterized protein PFL1_05659 [Pseudozyma flocculosa PF-1]|uniref:Uncharacterized protein n=2 Tax=Pseudozyma flocculosa TaxID=84751 RepID=A0A5C3FCJ5_9BASI|nr:uncharacterized protein PFL1_05659 [Pseudozyma flocculosa PF-1]EPQ26680.1 hypothetical protein PFL1_05659 [Pseudozyma flocculosa PF-1]SPO42154.1 uncharacterized protein PSFLO_07637 [Pseudozyma flocculosa]
MKLSLVLPAVAILVAASQCSAAPVVDAMYRTATEGILHIGHRTVVGGATDDWICFSEESPAAGSTWNIWYKGKSVWGPNRPAIGDFIADKSQDCRDKTSAPDVYNALLAGSGINTDLRLFVNGAFQPITRYSN